MRSRILFRITTQVCIIFDEIEDIIQDYYPGLYHYWRDRGYYTGLLPRFVSLLTRLRILYRITIRGFIIIDEFEDIIQDYYPSLYHNWRDWGYYTGLLPRCVSLLTRLRILYRITTQICIIIDEIEDIIQDYYPGLYHYWCDRGYYTGLLPRFVSLLTRSRILYRITTQVCIIIDEIEDIIQDYYPGLYHYWQDWGYYTGLLPRFVSLLTRVRILYRITTQVCIIIDEIEDIIQDYYPSLYHYWQDWGYYTGLLPKFVSLLTRLRILYRITTQVCIIIDEIEDIIQDYYPGLYHYWRDQGYYTGLLPRFVSLLMRMRILYRITTQVCIIQTC